METFIGYMLGDSNKEGMDNADNDDDGDKYLDVTETTAGSNPLDKSSIPNYYVRHSRYPYILSIRLPETVDLDKLSHESADKIAFSYGSACQSKSILPSHVLTAMGQESSKARRTIRVSLGAQTSEDHLDYL